MENTKNIQYKNINNKLDGDGDKMLMKFGNEQEHKKI